jgi:hypothetical protein
MVIGAVRSGTKLRGLGSRLVSVIACFYINYATLGGESAAFNEPLS